jgi:hypothetical protein
VPDRNSESAYSLRRGTETLHYLIPEGPANDRAVQSDGGAHLSRKLPALLIALALLAALPGLAIAQTNQARLIDVHATRVSAKPVAGSNCSNAGTANGDYELTGWVVQGNKTARLNTGTVPGYLGSVTSQMQASFTAWGSRAGVPDITVATGGTVTKATANHSYDLMFGRAGGNTIAVTYTWQWSNGEIESDTVFNNRLPWFIANAEGDGCVEGTAAYDVANIATHEFGHSYGLGHPASDRWETMYPYGYTGETAKRSLANGDIAGIGFLY